MVPEFDASGDAIYSTKVFLKNSRMTKYIRTWSLNTDFRSPKIDSKFNFLLAAPTINEKLSIINSSHLSV